jgi:hypothetical protein
VLRARLAHGLPCLPRDLEDDEGDSQAYQRVSDGRAQGNYRRTQHNSEAHERVDTGMVAIGYESRASESPSRSETDERGDVVSEEGNRPGDRALKGNQP